MAPHSATAELPYVFLFLDPSQVNHGRNSGFSGYGPGCVRVWRRSPSWSSTVLVVIGRSGRRFAADFGALENTGMKPWTLQRNQGPNKLGASPKAR